MRRKFYWESEKLNENSQRIKVIGGWIVIVENKKLNAITSTFVPDRDHDWVIIEKSAEKPKENEPIDFPINY